MRYSLILHGGAGFDTERAPPEKIAVYRDSLRTALTTGRTVLANKGTALDAVEKVVQVLEDNKYFNAGRGSVFNSDGRIEMEASIMCGRTMKVGSVAEIRTVKNPISLARLILDKCDQVFLYGEGAEVFAQESGLDIQEETYFHSTERRNQLEHVRQTQSSGMKDHQSNSFDQINKKPGLSGTVGAVALDTFGNLAAATSSGGAINKRPGRVGCSPIIGCGTYAKNTTCGISVTGFNERGMLHLPAYDISCMMEYKRMTLPEACDHMVKQTMHQVGDFGGVIGVDKDGNIHCSFNTHSLLRASFSYREEPKISIFGEDAVIEL